MKKNGHAAARYLDRTSHANIGGIVTQEIDKILLPNLCNFRAKLIYECIKYGRNLQNGKREEPTYAVDQYGSLREYSPVPDHLVELLVNYCRTKTMDLNAAYRRGG